METGKLVGNWFSEISPLWPGQAMSLEVDEVLFHERSDFQDVLVFKSKTYGTVLVLDGVIQCTERDEYSYQEMMAHIPMNSHPNPKHVLIVGGGDGGVAREVLKHPEVEKVSQCEIDGKVIEVCKKYLPSMACSYSDPRHELTIGDGMDFMKKHSEQFDVIITDSSDPIGPASSLFEKSYYELMKSALKPGGVICAQGECLWLHLKLIKKMQDFCRQLFPSVDYGYLTIPTYPSGQIGFTLCGKSPDTNFREPLRIWESKQCKQLSLKYYNAQVHRGCFTLPEFAKQILENQSEEEDNIVNGSATQSK